MKNRTIITFILIVFTLNIYSQDKKVYGDSIKVPIDYSSSSTETFNLYYELANKFDPTKKTLFIITDGQQFYVRPGSVKKLRDKILGKDFNKLNVVAIVGRGTNNNLIQKCINKTNGTTDREIAFKLFNSNQWIKDIESVRKHLLGNNGKIMLYGRSGGAYLTHRYISVYGNHVSKVFTQAAVNPFLELKLGIIPEPFWQEIGASNDSLQYKLQEVLSRYKEERRLIVSTIQRQNFYVSADKIMSARAELINSLYLGNKELYEKLKENYAVNAVYNYMSSPKGIPIEVRVYELFQPIYSEYDVINDSTVNPNMESQYNIASPLMSLYNSGKIPAPLFDSKAISELDLEIFLLSGYNDNTCSYQSQIYLSEYYKNSTLFIAKDNHVFSNITAAELYSKIIQTIFLYGNQSNEMDKLLEELNSFKWKVSRKSGNI